MSPKLNVLLLLTGITFAHLFNRLPSPSPRPESTEPPRHHRVIGLEDPLRSFEIHSAVLRGVLPVPDKLPALDADEVGWCGSEGGWKGDESGSVFCYLLSLVSF
ncbi:hypothetical protein CPC08DRAFT_494476 [Agrocybe pediades]|nr:hypothetical protein CPC08DRAFT_494476 [Agrocybe pediades]